MTTPDVPAVDASEKSATVRIRIGVDVYDIARPTDSQLLGVLMVGESGLGEMEQTQLMLKLTTSLMPPPARAAFIGKFIDGGYGINDLIETFKALTGIVVPGGDGGPGPKAKRAPRKGTSGNPAKRAAKRTAARPSA